MACALSDCLLALPGLVSPALVLRTIDDRFLMFAPRHELPQLAKRRVLGLDDLIAPL